MKFRSRSTLALIPCASQVIAALFIPAFSAPASALDTIGVTVLRQIDPSLQGSGIRVAHVEGAFPGNAFEVNPAHVGQPTNLFTWISSGGTATTFTNIVGVESGHANAVGANFYATTNGFYGVNNGVAPQVAHVSNYEANYFVNSIVFPLTAIQPRIVNQSFIFDVSDEALVNQAYDNYAAQYRTLFVSGIGNGDVPVSPAGTSYNGLGVGVYPGNSSAGPTGDGRSKPDLVAPGGPPGPQTSYSTPYVSGSAAVLLQAANRGDGGSNTNAANDVRTLKALLLNGAVKPSGWTNGPKTPLDARYGAGIVNLFNSWTQLKGGKRPFIESTTVSTNAPHPPGANTNNEPVLAGWDTNYISTTSSQDKIYHYYFNLPGSNSFTLTTTLVWNRQQDESAINNLNLFLYNTSNSNLVACSTSTVDNVEHLFLPQLGPGRYDLQVLKAGNGQVSAGEGYALAFEMFNLGLTIVSTNGNALISWPLSPTGFRLESAANLTPPVSWTTVNAPVTVDTNSGQNVVSLPATGVTRFFRLQRP